MDSQNSKINILIIGATGTLGTLVTNHCLTQPNLIVSILVRDPQKNKQLTAQVESAGGKVFKGDVTQPDTLKHATKGMHTVILTLPPFGDQVTVDGQTAVIDACIENKVERLVPSGFSGNISEYSQEETKDFGPFHDKIKIKEYLKGLPIKTLIINAGLFLETFFESLGDQGFAYWGDDDFKIQITTYEDTARIVAAAVAKKDLTGDIAFVGNEVSIKGAAEIYNRVRGSAVVARRLGSLEELKEQAEQLKQQGNPLAGALKMMEFVFDSRTSFKRVSNSEFPEVKSTSIEEFLKLRPDIIVK